MGSVGVCFQLGWGWVPLVSMLALTDISAKQHAYFVTVFTLFCSFFKCFQLKKKEKLKTDQSLRKCVLKDAF